MPTFNIGYRFNIRKYNSNFKNITLQQQQHGFMKGRSTMMNLVYFTEEVSRSVGMRQVDTIYTNFFKAIDRISHSLLCAKLRSFGLSGVLLDWLKS